ncbi:MAG: membrane protein insertase YidC [Gammaproteobacteria bacterium]|nr:MAG: membrane protein insertase YidC [Gammaproteobacteria bacterium]RLA54234.1 MAG: membrane protein insertase YidC [Gammaproteobacteria bacterium]
MDWQRSGLIAAMILVFGFLFIQWNEFRDTHKPAAPLLSEEALVIPGDIPGTDIKPQPSLAVPELSKDPAPDVTPELVFSDARLITVRTDVLEVTIDTLGGDIVKVELLEYLLTQDADSKPFVMLNRTQNQTYIAQSGLIGPNGTDTQAERPQYHVKQKEFVLLEGAKELIVELSLEDKGVSIRKEFVFKPSDYLIDVRYKINNYTENAWRAHLFGQIQRDTFNPNKQSAMGPRPYLGMAISTEEDNYKKLDFEDIAEESFKTSKTGGWVAMVQHYFVSAWVPNQEQDNQYQLRKLGQSELYAGGFTGPAIDVLAGEEGILAASFYVGPKDQQRLADISPYLDLTIDYGWLWWVAKPLFAGLQLINNVLQNWGWSIIVLTIVVKLMFFPLSAASYRSMARMRKLQPEMTRLRELYSDDRQKLSQEMMGLYKKEKVNPVGGCFPMLIQMPVFIALYWVLNESVELRHTPWILWIKDLSMKDPYYVLPVLNGISMFVLQSLQPAPPDPTQAKVMKIMPVAFSFFFMFFPAGLVLYWTVNSVLSIAQQWVITRKIVGKEG